MDIKHVGEVDIIGDIHGCYDELILLLTKLGYTDPDHNGLIRHPAGRTLVFVGDLCDRGPKSLQVLRFVKNLVEAGLALQCPGNHDDKLMRWCQGSNVQIAHGLETTVAEVEKTDNPLATRQWIKEYLSTLPLYLELDLGRLLVVHAGIRSELIGTKNEKKLKDICLFGFPTGKTDKHGLPERDPVVKHYRGEALLVHGHTPVREPTWERNVLNIDTGCVFGGKLTCFRYPEKVFVSVDALAVYGESKRFS
jgi:protein phosphatase